MNDCDILICYVTDIVWGKIYIVLVDTNLTLVAIADVIDLRKLKVR